jgi:eukaryotic-like serine/threonine-protein kinase
MNFSIGDAVGDYRILEELGRGGMGRVYKVEHAITQRLEAMKVLEGGRPDAPEKAASSLREIQVQARLEHPNIAAVHNAFWVGEDLVLVMELIDGCSLPSSGGRPDAVGDGARLHLPYPRRLKLCARARRDSP